ncbi:toxin glutamine deamidase domain-containing protein [Kitasatospora sp. NPDC059599]|uniref:toxin glutamine deamidase domain-containing protein n=1 Tax=Kitasatospora sp. NPDC059599 TaxID=3346880 RepID=UPI0036AF737A
MSYPSLDPGEFLSGLFGTLAGMPWPQVKEGELRDVRDAYEVLAKEIPQLHELIATVAIKARQEFEGEAAQSFSNAMNAYIGLGGGKDGTDQVKQAAETAQALADCAGDVANSVEYTKWMAIAQLIQLVFEITMATIWAPFTFGESFSGLSLAYFFTRQALWTLLKFLLKSILMHTFTGIVTGMLMDSIIQGIQISHGDRKSFDLDGSFKQSVLNGVIGGALAGPINLLGMGLGKLIGNLIGKNAGKVLSKELANVMKNGDKEALKHLLNTVTKEAGGSALTNLEKAGAKSIGKAGSSGLEGAGKSGAGAGVRKLLTDEEAKAFSQSLGRRMQEVEPWLKQGFGKAGAGSVAERFTENLAGSFEKHLGTQLGKTEARKLGQEYAEAFVAGWTKHGAGNESLGVVLRSVLEHGGSELGEHGVTALAEHLPKLAATMGEGNKLYRLGFAVGSQLMEGVQGNLSEGFYNLIFDDSHTFTTSAATFGAGMGMGLLGKGLHAAFHKFGIGDKWTSYVQSVQFKEVEAGKGAYFGPLHPMTALSLLSNLAGHPAPFPVPRLGPHHEEVTTGHVLGYSRGTGEAPDVEYAALFAKAFGQADLASLFADPTPKPVPTTSGGGTTSGKHDPATGSGRPDTSVGGKADRPSPVQTEGGKPAPGRPAPVRTDTGWSGTTLGDEPVGPARPGRTVGGGTGGTGGTGGSEKTEHAGATGSAGPNPEPPTPPRTSGDTPDGHTAPRPEHGAAPGPDARTPRPEPGGEPARPEHGSEPAATDEWPAPWWIKADFPEGALPHWTDHDFTDAAHRILQRPDRSYPDPERPSGALILHEGTVDGVRLAIGVEDGKVWQIRYLGGADTPRPEHGTPPPPHQGDPAAQPGPDARGTRPDRDHGSTDQPQQPSRRRGRDEYENDHPTDHGDPAPDAPATGPEPAAKRPRPDLDHTPDGRRPFDQEDGAPRPLRPLDSFLREFSDGGYDTPGPAARHALEQALAGPDGPKKFAHPREFVDLVNPEHGDGSLLGDVNCVAAAMAFHATFHGDPQVALTLNERHLGAVGDAQHWTGRPAEYLGLGSTGLIEVARRVTEGGPGSAALVFAWTEDGKGHAWNLVNVPGEGLVWVDAQQGLHAPGGRPLPQDVTRVWAITLDPENRPIHGDGGFNAAALHPDEHTARPTPAEAFTGADGPSHPAPRATGAATPHSTETVVEAFPPPGDRVRVDGDGLCLLNSVATSRPDAVHQVLTERGATGSGSRAPLPSTPGAMKRAVTEHLLTQGPEKLPPEVARGYRTIVTQELGKQLAGQSRPELLNGLLDLGVGGVATHEVVPAPLLRERYVTALAHELGGSGGDPAAARAQAEQSVRWKFKGPEEQRAAETYLRDRGLEPATDPHDLRRQYVDERVARGEDRGTVEHEVGWNFADGSTRPEEQFEFLLGRPEQIGLHDLSDAELADLQVWHRTISDAPLSHGEFAGLQDAVRNWERSWWQGYGETFPPLLADALGLRLRILGPDGHGGHTEYLRYGPPEGHQVTVYYNGSNHYDASRPPVTAPSVSTAPPTHPAGHDGPVLPPAPHSVPTVSGHDRPGASADTPKPGPESVGDIAPKPEAKPAPKPVVKTESDLTPKPVTEPGSQPATDTVSKPTAEASVDTAPKAESGAGTKPATDTTPKPEVSAPHRSDIPTIVITEADHDPLAHPAPPSPPASVLAMSVFSTESGDGHGPHDPAFTPKKPLGPDELRLPPTRITNHRRLSASDLVVGLHHGDTAVHQQIVKLFESAFPKDLPAARTLAKDFFDPDTLRPRLTALSRGDVWEAPFETDGWSGKISVRVDVDGLVHQDTAPSVEFENGSDRHASVGLRDDTLNRFNASAQAKFKLGKAEVTETFGYQHDSVKGSSSVEVGRSIARGKTVEPGALFAGKLHLALDFTELTHHGEPVFEAPGDRVRRLEIGVTVGIPVRDTLDVYGAPVPPAKDKLFAPPQRVVEGRRLGGSDIVLDVSTHRHGRPDADHPMQEILDGVEKTAEEVLGDLWPSLRDKLSTELDTTRLQQDLKSMMSGEPTRIEVVDRTGHVTGSVEIAASVKAMWQHGNTPQTEFNVGTGVQRVRTEQRGAGDGVQLPLPGVVSGSAIDKSTGSGGGGLQLIKDTVQISGNSQETLLTTKTKGPGVVYDGRAELSLTFAKDTPLGKSGDTATTSVDFRALIEQAEARSVQDTGAGDPTLFVAADTPEPHQPRTFEPGSTVPSPPDGVWRKPDGTGGGFGDTTTVRDLPTVEPLHEGVERLGEEVLGGAWKDVKRDVQQLFSHPMVASHLTAMTRGTRLELPEQIAAALLKHGVKVSATAHITELEYKRPNAKAELNPVDETSSFSAGRTLLSDTKSGQGAAGGTVPLPDKIGMDVGGGYSRQVRNRDGWRDGNAQKVYANGKYARPQEIYDAGIGVEVRITVDGKDHTVTVPIRAEVSLDAKETGRHTVGADGRALFTGPGTGTPVTHQGPAEPHDPPRRITDRGALSASDVVHSFGNGDTAVLNGIETTLQKEFGHVPDDVLSKIKSRFDPIALKPQLSKLTRGGKLTEHVTIHGWDTTVTVKAGLRKDFTHTDTVDKFEFELGTQTRVTTGVSKDRRVRDVFTAPFRFKLPHVDLGLNVSRRNDFVHGSAIDSTGATVSKGKTVEQAGLFSGTAEFTVHIEAKKLGQKVTAPDVHVPVDTTVAVPLRDAPLHGSTETAPLKKPLDPPARVEKTHRLGSSDVVTDVYPLRPRGGGAGTGTGPHPAGTEERPSVGDSAVSGLDRRGAKVLGSDWAGMKEKIRGELDVTKLQPQLKSMMSGHEIVVKHGRSTVRITAGVSRLEHTGETAQTEFNTGTQVQKSMAGSDGVTSYGAGRGNVVTVSVQGTSSPLPVGPAVTGGGSVTHSWGHDQLDVQAQRSTAGAATKTKLAGSAYTGEAILYFRMERRPLISLGDPNRLVPDGGTQVPGTAFEHVKSAAGQAWREVRKLGTTVHGIDTAKVGFEVSVEAGEGRPAKGPKPTPFEAPEHRTGQAPAPAPTEPAVEKVVKAPPARVWNEGLRDIDVMRWLGDAGGVQDILRLRGPEFFGSRTWDRMESLARNTTDHAQLASHFGSATRGESLSTPSPGRRLLVSDGGVKVNLKVLQLEYDRTDGKVELSPSNATSTTSTKTRLDWSLWGGQVQGGVKTDVVAAEGTFQVGVGGSHRSREGVSAGSSGQVVSHAKFNTPMARYEGFAEVEVVFFKGDKEVVEKGVIPITVDIPERETVDAKVMSDHYLTFSEDNPDGLAMPKHPPVKPAATPDATPPADPAAAPKPEATTKPEAEKAPKPEAAPKPEPEAPPEAKPEAAPKPEASPKPEPEAAPEVKPEVAAKPEAAPDSAPRTEPEVKPDPVVKAAEDVFDSLRPEPGSVPVSAPGHPKLSDLIPESSWWRLFIDANVHQDALVGSPSDAANHLDRTKYPGFRRSMTELFREVLDGHTGSGRDWSRIDVHAYEKLHDLATRHLVEGSGRNVATEWSGTKGARLHTTMRGTGRTTLAADLADDLVNGRRLLGDITAKSGSTTGVGLPLVAFSRGQKGEGMISISYVHGEAPGHVQAVLDRYYGEVAAATDDRSKLLAIAEVTRALQIIQPFSDANSRVNVSVLMQKFLLEQGFRPSVLTNSFELFLGGYSTHEIADHLVEGMQRFDQYVAGGLGDQFNTAAGPADHTLITQVGDAVGLRAGTGPGDAAVHHHRVLDLVRLGRSLYGSGVPSFDASGVEHLRTTRDLSDLAHAMFPGHPTGTAVAMYAHHLYEPDEQGVSWEHLRGTAEAIERTTKEGLPLTEADIRDHLPTIEAEGLTEAERRLMRGVVDEPPTAPVPTGSATGAFSWESVRYESPQDGLEPAPFEVRELSGGARLDPAGVEEALMPQLMSKDMGSFRVVLRAEDGLLTDPHAAARRVADTFMAPVDLLIADADGGVHLTRFRNDGFPYENVHLEVDHSGVTPHPAADAPSHSEPKPEPHLESESTPHVDLPPQPGTHPGPEHPEHPEHPAATDQWSQAALAPRGEPRPIAPEIHPEPSEAPRGPGDKDGGKGAGAKGRPGGDGPPQTLSPSSSSRYRRLKHSGPSPSHSMDDRWRRPRPSTSGQDPFHFSADQPAHDTAHDASPNLRPSQRLLADRVMSLDESSGGLSSLRESDSESDAGSEGSAMSLDTVWESGDGPSVHPELWKDGASYLAPFLPSSKDADGNLVHRGDVEETSIGGQGFVRLYLVSSGDALPLGLHDGGSLELYTGDEHSLLVIGSEDTAVRVATGLTGGDLSRSKISSVLVDRSVAVDLSIAAGGGKEGHVTPAFSLTEANVVRADREVLSSALQHAVGASLQHFGGDEWHHRSGGDSSAPGGGLPAGAVRTWKDHENPYPKQELTSPAEVAAHLRKVSDLRAEWAQHVATWNQFLQQTDKRTGHALLDVDVAASKGLDQRVTELKAFLTDHGGVDLPDPALAKRQYNARLGRWITQSDHRMRQVADWIDAADHVTNALKEGQKLQAGLQELPLPGQLPDPVHPQVADEQLEIRQKKAVNELVDLWETPKKTSAEELVDKIGASLKEPLQARPQGAVELVKALQDYAADHAVEDLLGSRTLSSYAVGLVLSAEATHNPNALAGLLVANDELTPRQLSRVAVLTGAAGKVPAPRSLAEYLDGHHAGKPDQGLGETLRAITELSRELAEIPALNDGTLTPAVIGAIRQDLRHLLMFDQVKRMAKAGAGVVPPGMRHDSGELFFDPFSGIGERRQALLDVLGDDAKFRDAFLAADKAHAAEVEASRKLEAAKYPGASVQDLFKGRTPEQTEQAVHHARDTSTSSPLYPEPDPGVTPPPEVPKPGESAPVIPTTRPDTAVIRGPKLGVDSTAYKDALLLAPNVPGERIVTVESGPHGPVFTTEHGEVRQLTPEAFSEALTKLGVTKGDTVTLHFSGQAPTDDVRQKLVDHASAQLDARVRTDLSGGKRTDAHLPQYTTAGVLVPGKVVDRGLIHNLEKLPGLADSKLLVLSAQGGGFVDHTGAPLTPAEAARILSANGDKPHTPALAVVITGEDGTVDDRDRRTFAKDLSAELGGTGTHIEVRIALGDERVARYQDGKLVAEGHVQEPQARSWTGDGLDGGGQRRTYLSGEVAVEVEMTRDKLGFVFADLDAAAIDGFRNLDGNREYLDYTQQSRTGLPTKHGDADLPWASAMREKLPDGSPKKVAVVVVDDRRGGLTVTTKDGGTVTLPWRDGASLIGHVLKESKFPANGEIGLVGLHGDLAEGPHMEQLARWIAAETGRTVHFKANPVRTEPLSGGPNGATTLAVTARHDHDLPPRDYRTSPSDFDTEKFKESGFFVTHSLGGSKGPVLPLKIPLPDRSTVSYPLYSRPVGDQPGEHVGRTTWNVPDQWKFWSFDQAVPMDVPHIGVIEKPGREVLPNSRVFHQEYGSVGVFKGSEIKWDLGARPYVDQGHGLGSTALMEVGTHTPGTFSVTARMEGEALGRTVRRRASFSNADVNSLGSGAERKQHVDVLLARCFASQKDLASTFAASAKARTVAVDGLLWNTSLPALIEHATGQAPGKVLWVEEGKKVTHYRVDGSDESLPDAPDTARPQLKRSGSGSSDITATPTPRPPFTPSPAASDSGTASPVPRDPRSKPIDPVESDLSVHRGGTGPDLGAPPAQHPQPEHRPEPEPQQQPEQRPERVHEMVDALVDARAGSDVRWLADPDSPVGQRQETGGAVARFPKDPRFFSVAFHSEHADGSPTWHGERVGPEELAAVLVELRARGIWAEGKPLQFPACEFGTGKASSYAADVLRALRGKVSGPLEAYVPEGKLWFVPKPTGAFTVEPEGLGHLVVAKTVGFDANGLPVVVPGGTWLKVSLPETGGEHPPHPENPPHVEHPENPEHPQPAPHGPVPHVEELGAHLPADLSVPASHEGLPEGLHWADSPSAVAHEMPGATVFGKRPLYDAPEYAAATAEFEKRLGAYCHNLKEAEDAARRTVAKLLYVIQKANPEVSALDRFKTLLKDDPTSAGQVGTDLTPEQIAGLLKTGNTRELMTAFFNGAYFNDSDLNLKKLLNSLIEGESWERAEELGLNVAALKEHHAFLEGPVRKGLHESLSRVSPKHATMFEHDVFGTGNVLAQSESWFSDGKGYLASLTARRPRPTGEVQAPSALDLDIAGTKLSERELAFLKVNPLAWDIVGLRLERVLWEDVPRKADGSYDLEALKSRPGVHDVVTERGPGGQEVYKLVEHRPNPEVGPGEIGPDKPISWRTGEAVHTLSPDSSWYKEANGDLGMRLVAGISATSAKLMTAFRLLNVDGVSPDHMVKALFGWMLPTGDHSVYEILKGVEMSGATRPLGEDTLKSAESMYRNLPGIPLDQVRRELSPDHMLPHEQVYLSRIKEQNGGFSEPSGPHRTVIEERRSLFEQIAEGVMDPHADTDVVDGLNAWLATNHMTAQEVLSKLTPAHFYALAVYTGPAFPLINVMMRFGDSLDKAMLVQIKNLLWGSGATPTSLSLHPAIKDLLRVHSGIKSVEMANRRKIMEIVRTDVLPGLKAEMREHIRMLDSALEELPAAEGKVYRGTAAISFKGFTGLSPSYGGSHVRSSDFASASRQESVALKFRDTRRRIPGTEPLLVTMELTGGGAAKDISAFSVEMQEKEVLGKPGSTYTVIERRRRDNKLFINVKEANSSTSFPMLGTPGTPGTPTSAAALRRAREDLQEHLADISGMRGVKDHKDLWALGKEIGVSNAEGLRGWSAANVFPGERAKEVLGEKTWHIGALTADLHGGTGHVDVERLRGVRRMADVVREALGLNSEQPVTRAEVDGYLRRLNKADDAAQVVPLDRHRLLKLVNSLKKQGLHVSPSDVEKAWTPLSALGTPRTPGTPGGHLTPAMPNTPTTPLTPTGHQVEQPGGHNPPGDLRRQPVAVFGAAPTLELHHQKMAAMQHFPLDDRFFTVAMHTDGGFPVHVNRLLSPDEVAAGLHQALLSGGWDGEKPLQFVACNLGAGIESSFVATTMSKLWALDPRIVAPAYAGDGAVWFVPKVDEHGVPDFGRRGDLVVAKQVGMTTSARPGISAGGSWYRFDRPTDGTLVPVIEKLGAYLPPTGDSAPRPENYLGVKDDEFDVKRPIPGAIPFDGDHPGTGLADQIFQELLK